jgi:hypothetical protein
MAHLYIAMQFGLYTAAFVFFAYKGGAWLDVKFNTYPIFTFVTILVSVFYSFASLINKMKIIDEQKKKIKEMNDNKKY